MANDPPQEEDRPAIRSKRRRGRRHRQRWSDVRRRLDAISLESASGRAGRDMDDRINALVGESFALERRLVRTPAAGLAGIAAKIRIATMLLRDFSARDSIENRLLASALRDLERLAAGPAD